MQKWKLGLSSASTGNNHCLSIGMANRVADGHRAGVWLETSAGFAGPQPLDSGLRRNDE